MFVFPKGDSIWFLVHHGDPFRREGSFDAGQALSVFYWPEKHDVLVYETASPNSFARFVTPSTTSCKSLNDSVISSAFSLSRGATKLPFASTKRTGVRPRAQ